MGVHNGRTLRWPSIEHEVGKDLGWIGFLTYGAPDLVTSTAAKSAAENLFFFFFFFDLRLWSKRS